MADSLAMSVLSTQLVQVQVIAIVGGALYNPTGDNVAMAFIPQTYPPTSPGVSDWHTAQWETDPGPSYWASCLVGPANGGVALAVGQYVVWARMTDFPAVPVLPGPVLTIF